MGKLKDLGWEHCEKVDGNPHHWKCNYCGITRRGGGVLRLKQHLAGQGDDVVHCRLVPYEVQQKMQLLLNARRTSNQMGCHDEHDAPFNEGPSWDKICKICSNTTEDGDGEFLICGHSECAHKYFHKMCLQNHHIRIGKEDNNICWYCPSCLCRSCLRNEHDELTVLCDGCDDAYHIYCMNPSYNSIPEGNWYCRNCICEANSKFQSLLKAVELPNLEENYSRQDNGHLDLILEAMEILDNDQ